MNDLCEKVREFVFPFPFEGGCLQFPMELGQFLCLFVAGKNIFLLFCQLSIEPQLFQFPTELAVLAFPCNQFGHQENATNRVLIDQTDYKIFYNFETLVNINTRFLVLLGFSESDSL